MMTKKVNVRRKKKGKLGKTIGILSIVTIMIAIVTLLALYQRKSPPIQREPAAEYFRFSEAQAMADEYETNRSIVVSEVYFNITLVGGKATDVVISPVQGAVAREDYPYFEEMKQNQTEEIFITYPYTVFSTRKDQGYPVYFDISCNEAVGRVTVYITEFFPPIW
jgi:hypothetical protein